MMYFILSLIILALLFICYKLYQSYKTQKQTSDYLNSKYSPLINIEIELENKKLELDKLIEKHKKTQEDLAQIKREISLYDETHELVTIGFYSPHFEYGTSQEYKDKINANKELQKQMIKKGEAVVPLQQWVVDGDAKKGKKMMADNIKLTVRSFNNECDVIIKNTTWKNISNSEQKIISAFENINKFNTSNQIVIQHGFLGLKLDELRLTHKHLLKTQEEKELLLEQKRIEKEEMELNKELQRIIREEEKLDNLLEKIKEKEMLASSLSEKAILQQEILKLSNELKSMQEEANKVKTMAQQTKFGYVYVISNIGSFGTDVFKVGMTRRVEPLDRIRELGSASVPFPFDVHAMIFSEDAPALERKIHNLLQDKRVNMVNFRKEFFKIEFDDLNALLLRNLPDVKLSPDVEAEEYCRTLELLG